MPMATAAPPHEPGIDPVRSQNGTRAEGDAESYDPRMVPLADVLEAIYRSRSCFRTLQAAGVLMGRTVEEHHRLWLVRPDRLRWERDRGDETLRVVQNGDTWWLLDPTSGEIHTNDGDPNHHVDHGPLVWLLDPVPLLGQTRLEVTGAAQVAGRAAALLRAQPRRAGAEVDMPGWSVGPYPLEVAIDVERGIALRTRSGEWTTELTEVAFDIEIPEETFDPDFVEDRPRRSSDAAGPREVSLEDVRPLLRFRVLLPSALPEGARLARSAIPGEDPPDGLFLSYVIDPGARASVEIAQGPRVLEEEARAWPDWRPETVDEVELLVREDRSGAWHRAMALVRWDDTAGVVSSSLPLDDVMTIALSLKEPT